MIDKDQIIKAQQEKIERVEKLQEELHEMAMFGMLTIKVLGLNDKHGLLECSMNIMHKASHAIKDVLNGMSPKEAIEKNMAENDEGEE
ncbi:hypothetical protein [Streptococcus pneumoniae]|uniref:hypothetical protein n=1 Tax=Streptococcus pneumoniae TaxID=1313 RepID=UPI000F846C59|nr:hypothetical protein [Streptococcus pneumoniae]RTZ09576.1 hypothetical protein CWI07_12125 [Streptococcus pneumoniae]